MDGDRLRNRTELYGYLQSFESICKNKAAGYTVYVQLYNVVVVPWKVLHRVRLCWWLAGPGPSVKVSAPPNHFPSAATTC